MRNDHVEFEGRLVKHLDMTGESAVDATTDPGDHGQQVAGTIAANKDNSEGSAGIAPEASLYVYGIGNPGLSLSRNYLSENVLRAINQAIADDVDIINMSIGSGSYDGNEETLLNEAYHSGIAVFAAAGSGNEEMLYSGSLTSPIYPAAYKNVCAVTALQEDGTRYYSANSGPWVDMAFPGVDIYTTFRDDYSGETGTSQACAVASGVAAVILSGAGDLPELADKTGSERVDALLKIMKSHAKKCDSKNVGSGATYLPDVFDVVTNDWDVTPAAPEFSVPTKTVVENTNMLLDITSATTMGVEIYYSTNGKTPSYKNGVVKNGIRYSGYSIEIGGQKKVTVKAIAVNTRTNKVSKVSTATYTFAPEPVAIRIEPVNGVDNIRVGGSIQFKATVVPSYASCTKVKWSSTRGLKVTSTGKVTVAGEPLGGQYVTATVVDAKGKPYETKSGEVITQDHGVAVWTAGALAKKIELAAGKSATLNIGDKVNLMEGAVITYADNTTAEGTSSKLKFTTSNRMIAHVSNLGVVSAYSAGTATITVAVNDGSNKKATFKVTVKQPIQQFSLNYDGGYQVTVDGMGISYIAPGKSITLTADTKPADASSRSFSWSVEAYSGETAGKVTVKNGKVTASKDASGIFKVTATTVDGSNISASYLIRITSPIKKFTMEKTMTLFVPVYGMNPPAWQGILNVKALDANGNASNCYRFYSSNSKVVKVDKDTGEVTSVSAGKATIYCVSTDGTNKKIKCNVTVKVPVSNIVIREDSEGSNEVYVGSSIKLKAIVDDAYGEPGTKKVKWSVDEGAKKYVSVSSTGVVKAKYAGDNGVGVTIYATAADGSGIYDTYYLLVLPKLKTAELKVLDTGMGIRLVTIVAGENGETREWSMPVYSVEVTAPKGRKVSVSRNGCHIYFYTDAVTTEKYGYQWDSFTSKDGFNIKVKVKIPGAKKTVTISGTLIKTMDGAVYFLEK